MPVAEAPREQYLVLNGLRLRFLERGPVNGRPMVLLHGTGDNARTWDLIAPHLASHFRVISLDQRGHGKSGWAVPPTYRCEDYMLDLTTLIDHLGLESMILLGHSMGALHASLYAALHPARVAALIHVDIEPFPPDWNRKYLLGLYKTSLNPMHPRRSSSRRSQRTALTHAGSTCWPWRQRPSRGGMADGTEPMTGRSSPGSTTTIFWDISPVFDAPPSSSAAPKAAFSDTRPHRRWPGPSRPARWWRFPGQPTRPTWTTPTDSGRRSWASWRGIGFCKAVLAFLYQRMAKPGDSEAKK